MNDTTSLLTADQLAKTRRYFVIVDNVSAEAVRRQESCIAVVEQLNSEICEAVDQLQKLDVEPGCSAEARKKRVGQIQNRKRASLASLFRCLRQTGLSSERGLTAAPLDVEFVERLFVNTDVACAGDIGARNDYFLRAILKLKLLQKAMNSPTKELSANDTRRCMGFVADLTQLLCRCDNTVKRLDDFKQLIDNCLDNSSLKTVPIAVAQLASRGAQLCTEIGLVCDSSERSDLLDAAKALHQSLLAICRGHCADLRELVQRSIGQAEIVLSKLRQDFALTHVLVGNFAAFVESLARAVVGIDVVPPANQLNRIGGEKLCCLVGWLLVGAQDVDTLLNDDESVATNDIGTTGKGDDFDLEALFSGRFERNFIELSGRAKLAHVDRILQEVDQASSVTLTEATTEPTWEEFHLAAIMLSRFEKFGASVQLRMSRFRLAVSKLLYILTSVFIELIEKGFCLPPAVVDQQSTDEKPAPGAKLTDTNEPSGLGDGEGVKDVSDQIENESQLEDLQGNNGDHNGKEEKAEKDDVEGIEMSTDFEAPFEDFSKPEENSLDENDENKLPDNMEERFNEEIGDGNPWDHLDEETWKEPNDDETTAPPKEKDLDAWHGEKLDKAEREFGAAEQPKSPTNYDNHDDETQSYEANEVDYCDEPVVNYQPAEQERQQQPDHAESPPIDSVDNNSPFPEELQDNMELDELNRDQLDDNKPDTAVEEDPSQMDTGENTNNDNEGIDAEMAESEEASTVLDENGQCKEDSADSTELPLTTESTEAEAANDASAAPSSALENSIQHEEIESQPSSGDRLGFVRSAEGEQISSKSTANSGAVPQSKNDLPPTISQRSLGQETGRTAGQFDEAFLSDDVAVVDAADDDNEQRRKATDKDDLFQHSSNAEQTDTQALDLARTTDDILEAERPNRSRIEDKNEPQTTSRKRPLHDQNDVDLVDDIIGPAKQRRHSDEQQRENADELESAKPALTASAGRPCQSYFNLNLTVDDTPFAGQDDDAETELAIEKLTLSSTDAELVSAWTAIEAVSLGPAQQLCERLRPVLEATKFAQLRGDYRTGKRLNMRRVIAYVASGFRNDKIWLRRTKPSRRDYRVLLAVDNSLSMGDNRVKRMAFTSMVVVAKALQILEVGRVAVASFGDQFQLVHRFEDSWSADAGRQLLAHFQFAAHKTNIVQLMKGLGQVMDEASMGCQSGTTGPTVVPKHLVFILSDGRGLFVQGVEAVKSAARKLQTGSADRPAASLDVFVVFIILDNIGSDGSNESVDDIKMPVFDKSGRLQAVRPYLDEFPFRYFVVLRDVVQLPHVLGDALQQWFQLVD